MCAGVRILAALLAITAFSPGAEQPKKPMKIGSRTQLFVDDVMIGKKVGVERRAHSCRKMENPVLSAEAPWETDENDHRVYIYGTVLYDVDIGEFRMWYNCFFTKLLYAVSKDGVHWERPALCLSDFEGSKKNNILPIKLHSPSIVLDETDSNKRYKILGYSPEMQGYVVAYSGDGLKWELYPKNPILSGGDTCTLARNPKTGEYLAFHKRKGNIRGHDRRLVYLAVSKDMQNWSEPVLIMAPDEIDDLQTQSEGGRWSEFYNMSAFPYGGQWLGLVTHFRYSGPPKEQGPGQSGADGPINVQLVHSRDGHSWERCEDRSPVIPNGPYGYDEGCILGVANMPVLVGDEIWIYYTAINTTHGGYLPKKQISIARASWRRDGFISLHAGAAEAVVETILLEPEGKKLIVNADASDGMLKVEILDANGDVIPGYDKNDCSAFSENCVAHVIEWRNHRSIPSREPIKLRFLLQNAELFAYRFDTPSHRSQVPKKRKATKGHKHLCILHR
jgi:hypothetical protein